MKQVAKLIVCLVLCLSLIWGYSYKEPVQAHAAATAAVVGTVVVALALGALGVTIGAAASGESVQQFLTDAYNNCKADVDANLERIRDGAIRLTEPVLNAVGNYITDYMSKASIQADYIKNFPHGFFFQHINVNSELVHGIYDYMPSTYIVHNGTNVYDKLQLLGWVTWDNIQTYSIVMNTMIDKTTVIGFGIKSGSGGEYDTRLRYNDTYYSSIGKMCPYEWMQWGKSAVVPMALAYYEMGSKKGYMVIAPQQYPEILFEIDAAVPANAAQPVVEYKEFVVNGHSVLVNGVSDTVSRIKEKVGVKDTDGTTVIPVTNTGAPDKVDERNTTQTQAQTIGQDISTEADKAANDAANAGKDTSVPKPQMPDLALPTLITKKFPFSIPWDLYGAVKGLVATPTPPKFVYPIKLERLGIDQSITIDFAPYDTLAAISRWGIGAAFLIWLIINTRKLIGGGD